MIRGAYEKTIEKNIATAGRLGRRIHMLGTLRLLLVVGLIALWVACGERGWGVLAAGSALFIVPFVWLMVLHGRLSERKEYADTLRELCENELRCLDGDCSALPALRSVSSSRLGKLSNAHFGSRSQRRFDGAPDKTDTGHSFCLDLDIFGERSLFASLNRTVIRQGRERLAEWLSTLLTDRGAILERQRAVRELAGKTALLRYTTVKKISPPDAPCRGTRDDLLELVWIFLPKIVRDTLSAK